MTTAIGSGIGELLKGEPPVEGARLDGWVALVEWTTLEGERLFELLGEPEEPTTQLKGYLHGGLYRMVTSGFDERRTA